MKDETQHIRGLFRDTTCATGVGDISVRLIMRATHSDASNCDACGHDADNQCRSCRVDSRERVSGHGAPLWPELPLAGSRRSRSGIKVGPTGNSGQACNSAPDPGSRWLNRLGVK
jgi:hypothetical protein